MGMRQYGGTVARTERLASAWRHEADLRPLAADGVRKRGPRRTAEGRQRCQVLEVQEAASTVDTSVDLPGPMIGFAPMELARGWRCWRERHDVARPGLERQIRTRQHERAERQDAVRSVDRDVAHLPADAGVGVDEQRVALDTALLHRQCAG